ncbi:hypothetical protein BOTCAL_0938g00010 [Botryotinia calthae]|uniref:Rhodopsin domain-containing protein n=1 Tax=Botryotinia calthae TaxID=38488 RepID=A0A4Y8CFJ3_9HELO|nr:hypothetical protein BOTCAL_0938g00010 [Botryotinia calthae]
MSYVQSGFAIITDIFLTASPIAILWNKLAICGLMSLGLMATIANALRNAFIPSLEESDLSHTIVPIVIVADLEFSLGVIAACVPTIMPLFSNHKNKESKTYNKMSGVNQNTIGSHGAKLNNGVMASDIELCYPYNTRTIANATFSQDGEQISDAELPLRVADRERVSGLQIPISTSWKVESKSMI